MKPGYVWSIQQRVKKTIETCQMIPPKGRVLLAVSGGPDSMVLLDIISHLMDEMNFQARVCHVNHNLRGKESMADERFVVEQSSPYVLPLTVRRFDLDEIEEIRKGNLEENARNLRYQKMIHTAIEFDCTPILTGHTKSDQAETILHRLTRSTGPSGLSGILPVRRDMEVSIARPLLDLTRAEVMQYIKEANLAYCSDAMNEDEQFTRVKLRKRVMPIMRELNPNVDESLANLATIARDEDEFWEQHLYPKLSTLGQGTPEDPADRLYFMELLPAEQRRLLRILARQRNAELSYTQTDQALTQLNASAPQSTLNLSSGMTFYRRYDSFFFAKPGENIPQFYEKELAIPGQTTLKELGVAIDAELIDSNVINIQKQDPNIACFDAALVKEPVTIRNRLAGDTIIPLGMQGKKKVKKIMQEKKVPEEERNKIPIVCVGNQIAWVCGLCVAETFRVTSNTKQVLQLKIIRM